MSFNMYSHDEVVDATESLYQALCVAYLLKGLGDECGDVHYMRLNDLGALFIRLVDCPLTILNELRSETGDHDPTPGEHKPELVSISQKQDAGGVRNECTC